VLWPPREESKPMRVTVANARSRVRSAALRALACLRRVLVRLGDAWERAL
jgi:hypothetical protein